MNLHSAFGQAVKRLVLRSISWQTQFGSEKKFLNLIEISKQKTQNWIKEAKFDMK